MRYWLVLFVAALAGCSQATASKVDAHTFRIQGPALAGGSSGPDRQLAQRICPSGYRVLNEDNFAGGSGLTDRGAHADMENPGTTTSWTIRCL
ncbi:MAG TPA: hypothetical protein VND87_14690 [Stellaceae bacterium]|nr:hypothetical protein [Stellaceae bacterium]